MKRLITVLAFLGFGALALPACGGDNIHSAQVVTTANGDTVEIWCDGNTFHSRPVRQSVEFATSKEITEPNSPYCKAGRVANDPTRDSWFDWWLYSQMFRSSPYYGSYAYSPPPQRTIVQIVNNTPARAAASTSKPTATVKPTSPTTKSATPTTKSTTKPASATLAPPKATLPAPDPKTRVPDAKAPPAPTSKSSSSGTKSSSSGSSSSKSSSSGTRSSSSGSSSRSSSSKTGS